VFYVNQQSFINPELVIRAQRVNIKVLSALRAVHFAGFPPVRDKQNLGWRLLPA